MHAISLEAAVRAAWSLHLIGPFPNLPGVYARDIHYANGMSPWLRLALGDAAARDIEKSGRAAWTIGHMLGMEGSGRHLSMLSARPDEMHAICIVDYLCREYPTSSVLSLLATLEEVLRGTPGEVFVRPLRVAADESVANEFGPLGPWVPVILRAMADSLGIVLGDDPADLSVWSEKVVGATVVSLVPEDRAENGFVKDVAHAIMDCEDGVVRRLDDLRGTRRNGSHLYPDGARKGMRLLLTFSGTTSGHCGYLTRVRDRDTLDMLSDLKSRFDAMQAVAARVARILSGTFDANGRRLSEGDDVELCHSCLEASQGSRGRVLELMDDVVLVDFGERLGEVPCYPHSIAVLTHLLHDG